MRLGQIVKAEEADGGLVITVKFDSDVTLQKARRIIYNLRKALIDIDDDHLMVGLATEDFYDGP